MNITPQIPEEGSRISISSFLIHFLSPPSTRELERAPICLLSPQMLFLLCAEMESSHSPQGPALQTRLGLLPLI